MKKVNLASNKALRRQWKRIYYPAQVSLSMREMPFERLRLYTTMLDNMPMVVKISGVHEVAAVASGVDRAGNAVQVDLTAYALDAGDAGIAVDVVEAEVLNEPVIPDGAGTFVTPQEVTAISVEPAALATSPLVYRHEASGANAKFPINSIHEIQVFASMVFGPVSTTLAVYALNTNLRAAIALAKSEVMTMQILPDPEVPGQMDTPDSVVAISAKPVSSLAAPWSQIILRT